VVLLALQISKGHLEHSALEVVVGESQWIGSRGSCRRLGSQRWREP
jgi:hypothetical protein